MSDELQQIKAAVLTQRNQAEEIPMGGVTVENFHQHLDRCEQCAKHPFDLCAEGKRLIYGVAGFALPDADNALAERDRRIAELEQNETEHFKLIDQYVAREDKSEARIAELEAKLTKKIEHSDAFAHAAMLDQKTFNEAQKYITALEAKLQTARPYMQHDLSCQKVIYRSKPCDCGYAEALEKIGKET